MFVRGALQSTVMAPGTLMEIKLPGEIAASIHYYRCNHRCQPREPAPH